MRRAILALCFTTATIFGAFLMEPLFPLGDWRWGIAATICMFPALFLYRREIWTFLIRRGTPQKPGVDCQPIYHAYKYLEAKGNYLEGDEPERIAEYLRQEAYDKQITIWGAKEITEIEGQRPFRLAISHEYWENHAVDPVFFYVDPEQFPDNEQGHVKSYQERMPEGVGEIYYYLHIDMNEIHTKRIKN